MRSLPLPCDDQAQPYNAGQVFETCVSMVRDIRLQAKLRRERATVEAASNDYHSRASVGRLYQMARHTGVGGVSRDQMMDVYTQRMVPKSATGRRIYDRILSLPENGKCPLCGIGTVNTLDHYLPKEGFPVFSVTPWNLVAACQWCQREKGTYYPETKKEQLLHPYFDQLGQAIWLKAKVVPGAPAAFRFFASPPANWNGALKGRVVTHLKQLKLPKLFADNAGSRLVEIRGRLRRLRKKGGKKAVRAHLQEELESIEEDHANSWTAAMYRAAVASDWFCDGGFLAA